MLSQLRDLREVSKPPEGTVASTVKLVGPTLPLLGPVYRSDELMAEKCWAHHRCFINGACYCHYHGNPTMASKSRYFDHEWEA